MNVKHLLVSFLIVLFSLAGAVWFFIFGIHLNRFDPETRNSHNAVWIKHEWVDRLEKQLAIKDLVKTLQKHNLRYVYVHVGPLESDGTIPQSRFLYASDFITKAKSQSSDITYLAWIGQLRSKIDLDSLQVRKNIAEVSGLLVQEVGFEGIHVDIEPISDGDEGFFLTLGEISQSLASKGILSVAVGKFVPSFVPTIVDIKQFNTGAFFERLDSQVNQIVVMTYETKLRDARMYSWFVEQQVVHLSKIVKSAELLIGIPSYSYEGDEVIQFPDFHPEAENIQSGLIGVIRGINNIRSTSARVSGVAVYAEWETDDSEWKVYDELWKGRR